MPTPNAAQRAEQEAAEKAAAEQAAREKAAADAEARNAGAEDVKTGREAAPTETVKQDKPEPKADKESVPQSYVWLTDGSVLRVNDEDLPGASGAQNPHGHWQRGNNVYEVVAIYPVETVLEG